jgi:chitinase
LLTETKTAFKPHKLQVSIAIGSHKTLSKEAYAAVDVVNVMSYDHGARHSTYDHSVKDVTRQKSAGAKPGKICLGVPFYGRKVKDRSNAKAFKDLKKLHPKATADEVDGFYFNNAETIRKKTQFAIDNKLGGIMIWEIGQDAKGKESLLKVIHDTVKAAKK